MQVDLSYLGLACMSSRMYVRHVQIDWLGLHDDLACWLVVVGLHDSVASLQVNSSSNPCLLQSPPSGWNRVAVPLDVRDDP